MDELSLEKTSSLDKTSEEIVTKIVDEQDSEELKRLISLFNLNQSKKNILRADVFSKLLDKISAQMVERFDKRPGEFSNKELLEYLSTIKSVVDKTDLQPDNINIPMIQNNTQVNVTIENKLDKDSRERVADAIKAILGNLNSTDDIIDICENLEENNNGTEV